MSHTPTHGLWDDEVAWGESFEVAILRRWAALSPFARGAKFVIRSGAYADYDFEIKDKRHLPIAYVEVKRRRSPLARFGDAIFPLRKHDFAKLLAAYNIPLLAVTEYGCGALVEVNLTVLPARTGGIKRHDRGGKPVPHAFYEGDQLTVLAEASC